MDTEIQAKVNQILSQPLLNRNIRAKLLFLALSVETLEERQRFNTILDKMIQNIFWETNMKGGQATKINIQ